MTRKAKLLSLCACVCGAAFFALRHFEPSAPIVTKQVSVSSLDSAASETGLPPSAGKIVSLAVVFELKPRPVKSPAVIFESGAGPGSAKIILSPDGKLTASCGFWEPGVGWGRVSFNPFRVSAGKWTPVALRAEADGTFSFFSGGEGLSLNRRFFIIDASSPKISGGARNVKLRVETGQKRRAAALFVWLAKPLAFLGLVYFLSLAVVSFVRPPWNRAVWAAALFAALLGFGGSFGLGSSTERGGYDDLAAAFSRGQLSLPGKPDPEHLKLRDPYQFPAACKYQAWDKSLYGGKFYYYFGPAPALARILLLNVPRERFMFAAWTAAWGFFYFLFLSLMRKRFFPETGKFFFNAAALLGIFSPLSLFLVSSRWMHVEAVLAGSAFLMAGIYFFALADEDDGLKPLFIAGALFALAALSRATLALAAVPFALALVTKPKRLSAFLAPLAAGAAFALVYNYLRFDNPLEFGITYQLNSTRPLVASGRFFSLSYIPAHLAEYFFSLPGLACEPPFLVSSRPNWEAYKPVFSVFLISPLALFVLPGIFSAGAKKYFWPLVSAAVLCAAAVSANVVITTRYSQDFAPLLSAAGAVSAFSLFSAGSRKKRLGLAVLVLAAVISVSAGFCLRIHAFAHHEPRLMALYINIFG